MPSDSLRVYSTCKRCNRKLKNARAQEIGYGKICLEKHKIEMQMKNGEGLGEKGQESLTIYMF